MPRKCIAVIISKVSKKHQAEILKGIYESAFANYMNVAVFSPTIRRLTDEYYNGEIEIINLINTKKFAGIIYLPDTMDGIETTDVEKNITNPLVKFAKRKITSQL